MFVIRCNIEQELIYINLNKSIKFYNNNQICGIIPQIVDEY